MPVTPLAHIRTNEEGATIEHGLPEHLSAVSRLAADFAAPLTSTAWAGYAGIWHDLGKFRPGFQRYIRLSHDPDAHVEGRVTDRQRTHSAAGALWAERHLLARQGPAGKVAARVLSYLIAGHHAGLGNWYGSLKERLSGEDAGHELDESLNAEPPARVLQPELSPLEIDRIPVDSRHGPGSFALWTRMLFSCLVDADFLDTEAFMDDRKAGNRSGFSSIGTLLERFEAHMARVADSAADTPVNAVRRKVLRQCRDKAVRPPAPSP